MAPPNIKVRGAGRAKGIPTGYVLGRSANGSGDVQLLKLNDLRTLGLASHADVAAVQISFIQLTDVPQSYAAAALKTLRVNAGATGLEFVTQNAITSTTLAITGAGTAAVAIDMPNSGAVAGSYTSANITIDAQGRVTAAANGSGGGGGLMPLVNGDTDSVPRETLAANRTYFVATTGSDSNDGLTLATALLTGQAAVNKAAALDLNTFTVTIQFSAGTYTNIINIGDALWLTGKLVLQGDIVTPANVVFSGTSLAALVKGDGFSATAHIQGFKFTGTGNTAFIWATNGATLFYSNCEFSTGAFYQVYANLATVRAEGGYTISGGAIAHLRADVGGKNIVSNIVSITLTGTPAFSTGFAYAIIGGLIAANSATFVGSATGPRYDVETNSIIFTGGGATFLPGNAAGVALTGGQYA